MSHDDPDVAGLEGVGAVPIAFGVGTGPLDAPVDADQVPPASIDATVVTLPGTPAPALRPCPHTPSPLPTGFGPVDADPVVVVVVADGMGSTGANESVGGAAFNPRSGPTDVELCQ